jgi:hypothetical protein
MLSNFLVRAGRYLIASDRISSATLASCSLRKWLYADLPFASGPPQRRASGLPLAHSPWRPSDQAALPLPLDRSWADCITALSPCRYGRFCRRDAYRPWAAWAECCSCDTTWCCLPRKGLDALVRRAKGQGCRPTAIETVGVGFAPVAKKHNHSFAAQRRLSIRVSGFGPPRLSLEAARRLYDVPSEGNREIWRIPTNHMKGERVQAIPMGDGAGDTEPVSRGPAHLVAAAIVARHVVSPAPMQPRQRRPFETLRRPV